MRSDRGTIYGAAKLKASSRGQSNRHALRVTPSKRYNDISRFQKSKILKRAISLNGWRNFRLDFDSLLIVSFDE